MRTMKLVLSGVLAGCSALALAASPPALPPPLWAAKPDVAAFQKIEDGHIAAAKRSIDAILAVKGRRTIENTLVPYDDATRELDSARVLFRASWKQVAADAAFRDAATAMTRKVSAVQTDLSLDRGVYDALAALDLGGSDPATKYYVSRQLFLFKLRGVDKDDATRARLKKLNDELTEEQSAFERNISDDIAHDGRGPGGVEGPAAGLHRPAQAGRRRQGQDHDARIRTRSRR